MKKNFAVIIFFLILFFLYSTNSFAQEEKEMLNASSSSKSASVDYSLPYPGLLPDNPFYILKVARDRITMFFLPNSFQKAEFNLLQADKRLNAGYYLFLKNSNKEDLVVSTISKGENYFDNSLKETVKAQEQGVDVGGFSERLINSAKKHQEILKEIETGILSKNKESIRKELKRVQIFEKMATEIKPK